LRADIAARLKLNAADESLIADLVAREGGTRTVLGPVYDVLPVKRRRRKARRTPVVARDLGRKDPKSGLKKPTKKEKPVPVAAPEPVVAKPKGLRGQGKFSDQIAELEMVRVALAAAGDDAKVIHLLQVAAMRR
jgi:hypothetical protein